MRTCEDCVYVVPSIMRCLEWRNDVTDKTPACTRFIPATGDETSVDFKPVMTIRIAPE